MNWILLKNGFPPVLFLPHVRSLYDMFVTSASLQNSAEFFVPFVQGAVLGELSLPSRYYFKDVICIGTNPGRVSKMFGFFKEKKRPLKTRLRGTQAPKSTIKVQN